MRNVQQFDLNCWKLSALKNKQNLENTGIMLNTTG
uniref:Uncharacterized protein n=1 Tax=Rhizophora mucronata TaxID=61149 RepID=A0A2P2PE34_RHIMU